MIYYVLITFIAKAMKIKVFVCLLSFSISSSAVEFYRCIDSDGKQHFTNMPESSLNKDCKQNKDHYAVMLEQDYSNLDKEFEKYMAIHEEELQANNVINDETINIGDVELKKPGLHIFDPDAAYDELIETTTERDDPITRFLRRQLGTDKPNAGTPLLAQ